MIDRIELAQIIDPTAWKLDNHGQTIEQVHSGPALSKADAILKRLAHQPAPETVRADTEAPALSETTVLRVRRRETWIAAAPPRGGE
jgi:hypothetical protein